MTKVLAYDFGGTKVEVGVVSERGKVLASRRENIDFSQGPEGVLQFLADLGQEYLQKYKEIKNIGIASAGPLHPRQGVLLDPTNFFSDGKSWGKIPIVKILTKKLKRKIILENDAAAAVCAESWRGAAKGYKDILMFSLGTGLGTGIITDGKLVRAGGSLHTEGGHLIVNYLEKNIRCGCGNFGCAEAYLSGKNFSLWASKAMGENVSAEKITVLARQGDHKALAQFSQYAEIMAHVLCSFVVLYAPQIVVFSGSFAASSDLFLKQTDLRLQELLARRNKTVDMQPKLKISSLHNQSGLLGAAYLALKNHS